MGKRSFAVVAASMLVAMLAACGGGGGSSAPPLQDPAFLNLAGTRWSVTDTVSGSNTCDVPAGTPDTWTAVVASQSGNTLTVYDDRATISGAVAATISGYDITFNGPRYPVGGCSDMTGSYNVTLNNSGTAFNGTAVLTCLDVPACTVSVTVDGSKN